MSYSVINEELRIQACSIADLNPEQFAEPLENSETITVIYNPVTDTVILNQEHPEYDIIRPVAIKYMIANSTKQQKIKVSTKQIAGDKLDSVFDLLDEVEQIREQNSEKKLIAYNLHIIGQQTAFHDEYEMIKAICEDNGSDDFWTAALGYSWGYIQGIRAERALRKKVAQ